ncbi:MAG: glycosyl transferase, partial [Rhodospirillales bacterium]|nr:glycosyl transferase [Rhodospirillales bacterium]
MTRGRKARPRFSVMISTLNRAEMLRRALHSVRRQTFKDFEVIVVDDGSAEDIGSVARDSGLNPKFLKLPENLGIPGARNAALQLADGEIAAFLDSDDLWHPHYLAYQDQIYTLHQDAIFGFTDYYRNTPNGSAPSSQFVPVPEAPNAILHMIMRPFVQTMSCFTAPFAAIQQIGGFTEALKRFSDLDLYIRLLAGQNSKRLACISRPAVGIPHILVLKNIHLADRNIDEYEEAWQINRLAFLDRVFSYEFMAPYQEFRERCEERL